MNPTQIFQFAMNWINQKKINLTGCYWAETAQMHSAQRGPRARPTAYAGRGPAWWTGDDTASVHRKRLRSSGSPTREWWTVARRRWASSGRDGGGVNEAVGTAARSARRSGRGRRGRGDGRGDGGAREAVGRRTGATRRRCRDARRGGWQVGPVVSDFWIKIHPEWN
jgi:hypothetical protein